MTTESTWHFMGECDSYTQDYTNQVTFHCGSARLRVKACAPQVIQVWCAPEGHFRRKYPSFSVQHEDLAATQLQVSDQGSYIQMETEALVVKAHKAPLRLYFYDRQGHLLTNHSPQKGLGWSDAGEMAAWHDLPPGECFWGLGEKREDFNRRGQRIIHWGTDLYQPDEFSPAEGEGRWYGADLHFLSSRGYSIFFDNTSRTCFDFGKTEAEVYSFGSLAPGQGGEMIYYLIHGPTPKAMIKTYTDLVGKPFFPPQYALGNGQSWWGDDWYQADIEACAQTYRDKAIPCDIMWTCLEWYLDSFAPSAWNYTTFPDPQGMIERLHRAGFKVALYDEPSLPMKSDDARTAQEKGYLLSNASGEVVTVKWPWGGESGLVDFFNPQARQWFAHLHDHLAEVGADCWWLDMNEPAVSSHQWVFHNEFGGEKGNLAEMHNVYALVNNQTMYDWYRQACPNRRPYFLSRSYFSGSHRYAAVWSGDVHAHFDWLRFQPRLGLSMGLSGFTFWGHDIGGYSFGNPDEELFKRWIEFAAFCPLHRFHHTSTFDEKDALPNFPWRYGAEEVSRRYVTLRERFIPYFYSCIADTILGTGLEPDLGAGGSGSPLMRAMVVEYPEDEATFSIDDQFLCGPSLLVAPVLERGARSRQVYFPAGNWYDYLDNQVYQGPIRAEVAAPLDRLPIFIRAGAILPMMPAMQYIGEKPLDPLTLDIFPLTHPGSSFFVLYEDDGESFDYQSGAWCTTRYECAVQSGRVELAIGARQQGAAGFIPAPRSYWLQFHNVHLAGLAVSLDGKPLTSCAAASELASQSAGWFLDKANGVCTVKIPDTGGSLRVALTGK